MSGTKIRTLIIEDEIESAKALQKMLSSLFKNISIVGHTRSIKESLAFLKENTIDLALVDISLEDGDSFAFLSQLKAIDFQIIFITAYNEHAIKAFKFNAIDYLLKPIDPEELHTATNRALSAIEKQQKLEALLLLQDNQKDQKIVLKTENARHILALADIYRLQADGSYTLFYLENKEIIVSKNLKHYENLLADYNFLRTHQSHLVNINKVTKLEQGAIILSNDAVVPVSSRKQAIVKEELSKMKIIF